VEKNGSNVQNVEVEIRKDDYDDLNEYMPASKALFIVDVSSKQGNQKARVLERKTGMPITKSKRPVRRVENRTGMPMSKSGIVRGSTPFTRAFPPPKSNTNS